VALVAEVAPAASATATTRLRKILPIRIAPSPVHLVSVTPGSVGPFGRRRKSSPHPITFGAGKQYWRDCNTERSCRFEIDDEIER
jgi:hypothetical protein